MNSISRGKIECSRRGAYPKRPCILGVRGRQRERNLHEQRTGHDHDSRIAARRTKFAGTMLNPPSL